MKPRQPGPWRPLGGWFSRGAAAFWLAFGITSCRGAEVRLTPLPSGAQAVSLLGDTLWNVPLPPGEGPGLVAKLHSAQRNLSVRPTDAGAKLLVARRTAALGRLRDAVSIYSEVIADDFGTARVYRRRGDLLLQLREMAAAERDLRRSATDPAGTGVRDYSEDSSGGLIGSLVRYQASLGLGVVRYVGGDYSRA